GEVGDRTEDARCRNCHQLIDPIGRAFAVLDPDNNEAVAGPEVQSHSEIEGEYANLIELFEAVAASRSFAECFSQHWLAFFLEQTQRDLDATWVTSLADAVQAGASLGQVVEHTLLELHTRSGALVPWCEGP